MEERIVSLLKDYGLMKPQAIADTLGISFCDVVEVLMELIRKGIVCTKKGHEIRTETPIGLHVMLKK